MLQQKIPALLEHINNNKPYLEHNGVLMDILDGNLLEYVRSDMQKSLSPQYFEKIEHRIMPINILKRLIDKLSKTYSTEPIRKVLNESESDKFLVDYYEKKLRLNERGNEADEYANLFKGFLFKPFIEDGEPMLRTVPYDRFLPYSDDPVNRKRMTVLIEMAGKKPIMITNKRTKKEEFELREVYYAWSDDEFVSFDSNGDIYLPGMEENEGVNDYGIIPAVYGNRSRDSIIPIQDSDLLSMTKVIPIAISDLSGVILFQCFSIIWGIDLDMEEAVLTPNGLWSLKSDPNTDKNPQVGVLKPSADISEVMQFILNAFTFWLETRGIKVGSVGNVDGPNLANGISKILDEMDTSEIRKVMALSMKHDEERLWQVLKDVHNYWVESGQIENLPMFTDDFEVSVQYDEPQPIIDREKLVRTIDNEVKKGYMPPKYAIQKLYPNLDELEQEEYLKYYESINSGVIIAPTENSNQDSERLQSEAESGDSSGDN